MLFVQAQKAKNDWWRYLLTLVMAIFVLFITNPEFIKPLVFPGVGALNMNQTLFLQLLPPVAAFFLLWMVIPIVHSTRAGYLVSAWGKIRWRRLISGLLLWLAMLLLVEVIFMTGDPDNYKYHFNVRQFLPLLIIALLMIPFQAWFEELLFRSYFLVGLGILFRSRLIALILTSVGFGALHLSNPEVRQFGFWETMPYYVGFGLFSGLLVIYDNGIELVCGIHAINNMYNAVLVNYDSSVLKTHSIWTIKETRPVELMLAFYAMAILFIFIMAKVYGWQNRNKIFQPLSDTA